MQLHVWWLSPEGGDSRLIVAHFRKGGPAYDDALSCLGNLPGRLLILLPTDLAVKLRCQLDNHHRLRVGWETVSSGALLALIHWDDTDEYRWNALVTHLDEHHNYISTDRGQPHLCRVG